MYPFLFFISEGSGTGPGGVIFVALRVGSWIDFRVGSEWGQDGVGEVGRLSGRRGYGRVD